MKEGDVMTNEEALEVDEKIAPWSLNEDHCFVTPAGKTTGVVLKKDKKGKYQALSFDKGTPLWSGSDPKYFIRHFWNYDYEAQTK